MPASPRWPETPRAWPQTPRTRDVRSREMSGLNAQDDSAKRRQGKKREKKLQRDSDCTRDLADLHFHTSQVEDLAGSVLARLDGKRRRLDARRLHGENEGWMDWQKDEEEELRQVERGALTSSAHAPDDCVARAAGASTLVLDKKGTGSGLVSFCDGGVVPFARTRSSTQTGRGWNEASPVVGMTRALRAVIIRTRASENQTDPALQSCAAISLVCDTHP